MLDDINAQDAACKATVERAQDKLQRLNLDAEVTKHQTALDELQRKASALRQVWAAKPLVVCISSLADNFAMQMRASVLHMPKQLELLSEVKGSHTSGCASGHRLSTWQMQVWSCSALLQNLLSEVNMLLQATAGSESVAMHCSNKCDS